MEADPKVVVLDDDEGILQSIERFLGLHGFETRTFNSAETLIDSGEVETAVCLLLDIQLGVGISGIDLRRRLAASGSKCPVIFMTARDDDRTFNDAMAAGCVAFLLKPFDPILLLDAIKKNCP